MSTHNHQTREEIAEELRWITKAKTDSRHFAPLYEKYFRRIFLFIYKRLDDEHSTADLTSQVFLKAIMNIKRYEFRGLPFSAWLYRIASNEVNMFVRAGKGIRSVSIEDAGLEYLKNEIELTDNEDNEAILLESFEQLSQDEIQYLELRFFENKSFKEVGYVLKITENNAKVKTYRILNKIRTFVNLKTRKL
ncbi:MAG: RNA polymerase sigma factor [Cytophagaceae bacterium]